MAKKKYQIYEVDEKIRLYVLAKNKADAEKFVDRNLVKVFNKSGIEKIS